MFISIIDEDRSGTIDFREFLILISQYILVFIIKKASTRQNIVRLDRIEFQSHGQG